MITQTTRTIRNGSDGQVRGYEITSSGTLMSSVVFGSAFNQDAWRAAHEWEAS